MEYSTPKKPPRTSPSFTSPNPILSLRNCPMRPMVKRKPANTKAPEAASIQSMDIHPNCIPKKGLQVQSI